MAKLKCHLREIFPEKSFLFLLLFHLHLSGAENEDVGILMSLNVERDF
jgi:hypothetical protein